MRPSAFVGRQAELTLLSDLAERARANEPQVALIEGEAGVGKSSLLAELGQSLWEAKSFVQAARKTSLTWLTALVRR